MNIPIEKLLDQFRAKHILVIGDVMLDEYLWGAVNRVSPEAPVPVVKLDHIDYHAGGAANVAENVYGLGCEVTMVGVIGDDENGAKLEKILYKDKRFNLHLIKQFDRPTTVKTRIMAQGQQMMRVDNETEDNTSSKVYRDLQSTIHNILDRVDGLILQDYGKGLLSKEMISWIMRSAKDASLPVYVDPKDHNYECYSGSRLLKPNLSEFWNYVGQGLSFEDTAISFKTKNDYNILLVTKGSEGMSIFYDNKIEHIPTKARSVHDVSGAGDTVISTFAVCDICGADPLESATISNYAAGQVCGMSGVVPIKIEDLSNINNDQDD